MLLALFAALAAIIDPAGGIFHGRDGEVKVPPPRIDAAVSVDGALSEPVWTQAAMLTGFSQFQPVDGIASADSTEVLVWYSPTAIHFGVRAFEAHGTVSANLLDRDRIFTDDHVQFFLGTFNDGRQATVFAVNPLGVQGDGTLNEGAQSRGTSARESADLSANFVYESKGRVTAYGYEVEIRIPFKSLRYQARDVQDWGLHVVRQVQHLGHEDSWVPARRGAASFLGQSGTLAGLRGLDRGLVVDAIPEIVARSAGSPDEATGRWGYRRDGPELGGNVRWGITNNLTLNGAFNPDFSQVEADVGALIYDPRQAIFFPERRPFFLDGIENYTTPNNLIYTRRVVKPDAAAKITGKVAGANVALLSAVDDRTTSRLWGDEETRAQAERPLYNILRVVRDVGGQSRVGLVYTDKVDADDYNRVIGADARVVFARLYTVRGQFARSFTRIGTSSMAAPIWQAGFDRSGRQLNINYSINAIDEDFRAASGFLSRTGIVNAGFNHRYTWFPKSSLFESYTFGLNPQFTWRYSRFVDGKSWQDAKFHVNNNFALKGGWRGGLSLFIERFGWDDNLYRNLRIVRETATAVDTLPYTGTPRLDNFDVSMTVTTPQWKRFNANLNVIVGQDENFEEWSSADIVILNGALDWRPTDKARVNFQYQQQEYNRKSDGTTVRIRKVPRLKVEYQVARPIFFRVVGQYVAEQRDSLRDDSRTNLPLLERNPVTGVFERAVARSTNDLRVDWLFSYQPIPGTVIFAGYGGSYVGPDHLRFRGMDRTDDGFFVKASYLFRL